MSASLDFACDRPLAASGRESTACARPGLVLAACILASSLAFIDGSVLNVALPAIGRSFGAATAELQWVLNAYLLPLAALLLVGGAAGDLYGRRRLLVAGILLFTAASLLCAVAPGLEIFLAARALQGLGAAIMLPSSLAILSAAFSGERRGQAVGTWAAAGAVAGAVAPLIGGWLIDSVGWRAIFLLNLPVAAGALALAWFAVPEHRAAGKARPDYAGGMLATLALGALAWGLTLWSSSGRAGPAALATIAAGLALSLAFLAVERRRRGQAMVPLALFGSRALVGLNLFTLLLYGALSGIVVLVPYLLIEASGYGAAAAGAALLPLPLIIALGSPLMGRFAARIGPRWPLTLGPLVVAVGFLLGLRMAGEGDYWTSVLPLILGVSIGMAIAVAPLTTAVLGSVDPTHVATASGLNSAVSRAGGLFVTALLGAVLAQEGAALVTGFHAACLAGAAMAALAGLIAAATLGGRKGGR
ncbi:MAG: DHA2 family efflux MFS transporter permease subunit [Sphingosinicella sp.]